MSRRVVPSPQHFSRGTLTKWWNRSNVSSKLPPVSYWLFYCILLGPNVHLWTLAEGPLSHLLLQRFLFFLQILSFLFFPFLSFFFFFFKKLFRVFFWQTFLRHFSPDWREKKKREGGMWSSMSYNVARRNGVYRSRQAERWQFWGKNVFCLSSHWCYQDPCLPRHLRRAEMSGWHRI